MEEVNFFSSNPSISTIYLRIFCEISPPNSIFLSCTSLFLELYMIHKSQQSRRHC
ncbi:hypothetical protein F383_36687 [Gossypium arboreum]|uniref:Uncharacterized protein n=1 Tax=Gossypium arboreum TaxID=29729 RepID=A0A0B0M5T1_GOSAR|nr:hypothetical protein F383_36687 [Gossypium arboreum]